jgi:hypothetical protein
MTPHEQIQANILNLQNALFAAHPTMPQLLRQIHTQLKADPDVVTLLGEKEIAIIIEGLKRQTATELVVNSKPAAKTARIKSVSVDDL